MCFTGEKNAINQRKGDSADPNELTGKNSTKQMTIMQLIKVLEAMENKVFKKTTKRHHSPTTENAKVNSLIAHKICSIWI